MPTLEAFHICMPNLATQKQIAHAVKSQLQVVEQVRDAARAQLNEIERLPGRILKGAYGGVHFGDKPAHIPGK
jgi:hypothetical protein